MSPVIMEKIIVTNGPVDKSISSSLTESAVSSESLPSFTEVDRSPAASAPSSSSSSVKTRTGRRYTEQDRQNRRSTIPPSSMLRCSSFVPFRMMNSAEFQLVLPSGMSVSSAFNG
uniref:Uncharacterized protein n=1 Tax=Anopheles minimus TaxID=112268 RepID=A0A182W5T5_9DIPT